MSRDDPDIDETTRLQSRIAELERVVRELCGRNAIALNSDSPGHAHDVGETLPRWAESGHCDRNMDETWYSRTSMQLQSSQDAREGDAIVLSQVKIEEETDSARHLHGFSASSCDFPSSYSQADSAAYFRAPLQSALLAPMKERTFSYAATSSRSNTWYSEHCHGDNAAYSSGDRFSRPSYGAPDSTSLRPRCSCPTGAAAGHPLISLTNQLQHTLHQLRQLPSHQRHHENLVLCQILEQKDTVHNISLECSGGGCNRSSSANKSKSMSPTPTSSYIHMQRSSYEAPASAAPRTNDPVSSGEDITYYRGRFMA